MRCAHRFAGTLKIVAKTSPNVPTDFTALQTQPTRAEIREFKLQHPELKPNSVFFTRGTKLFLAVGIAAIVLVPKVIDPRSHSAERLWVTTLLIILVLGVACWIFVSGRITASIVQYQLVRFAADNKLVYTSTGYRPDLPGMIFGLAASVLQATGCTATISVSFTWKRSQPRLFMTG